MAQATRKSVRLVEEPDFTHENDEADSLLSPLKARKLSKSDNPVDQFADELEKSRPKRWKEVDEENQGPPILTKVAQLVDGKVDLVAVQLNNMGPGSEGQVKNMVWVEKGAKILKNWKIF